MFSISAGLENFVRSGGPLQGNPMAYRARSQRWKKQIEYPPWPVSRTNRNKYESTKQYGKSTAPIPTRKVRPVICCVGLSAHSWLSLDHKCRMLRGLTNQCRLLEGNTSKKQKSLSHDRRSETPAATSKSDRRQLYYDDAADVHTRKATLGRACSYEYFTSTFQKCPGGITGIQYFRMPVSRLTDFPALILTSYNFVRSAHRSSMEWSSAKNFRKFPREVWDFMNRMKRCKNYE